MITSVRELGFSALPLLRELFPPVLYHLACQPGGGREAHDHQADTGSSARPARCESSPIANSHHENSKAGGSIMGLYSRRQEFAF